MRIDPCPDCGARVNVNSDHEDGCPQRQRPIGQWQPVESLPLAEAEAWDVSVSGE
ncbi:hypothetical protein SEA_WHEELBITE_47 [Arthrobacter phage Wheelbite]|uniref:Uncharacterized protein n=1 Tax=Arthrobacter phage Wheelbite TaxID=2015873 RepID=A0A222ZIH1_9CAUD|nr:hypothetical protein KMD23_gp47 [Arthrobacter phage Wheelbite]ASR84139.1 hypothetical protein SEA_WHEELBITE_47 [Arthrobacter phage Wheelbite]